VAAGIARGAAVDENRPFVISSVDGEHMTDDPQRRATM
jgi:hypothetical protein